MNQHSRRGPFESLCVGAGFALVLAGCAFTRPPPVKSMFLLDPALPAAAATPHPAALRVGALTVAGPFRDRSFVLRETQTRYATDFYDEFVTPPGPMLAEVTSRALSRARAFAHVAAPGASLQADYVLDGFVSALYADHRTRGACTAVIAVTFYLSQSDSGNGVPFWSGDYRRETRCRDESAAAYVEALNAGLAEILHKLTTDLAAIKLPPAP
ncbi:MAG: ABC-type transport auxiliary lipoprotein family protein [Casimicrobiaceae bacterium]